MHEPDDLFRSSLQKTRKTDPSSVSSRKAFQMSQNSKNSIGGKSFRFNTLLSVLTVVTIALASSSVAIAQNQFAPRTNFQQPNVQQPNFGRWSPPNTAGSFYQAPAPNSSYNVPATNQPPDASLPETIAPFELEFAPRTLKRLLRTLKPARRLPTV